MDGRGDGAERTEVVVMAVVRWLGQAVAHCKHTLQTPTHTFSGITDGGSASTYTTASVTSSVREGLWKNEASVRRTASLTPVTGEKRGDRDMCVSDRQPEREGEGGNSQGGTPPETFNPKPSRSRPAHQWAAGQQLLLYFISPRCGLVATTSKPPSEPLRPMCSPMGGGLSSFCSISSAHGVVVSPSTSSPAGKIPKN